MPTSATSVQHCTGTSSQKQVFFTERSKTVFADDMIYHTEKSQEFTTILLELVNEFSNVVECKVGTQRPTVFLYTLQWIIQKKN